MVSNRGPQFWKAFCTLIGSSASLSSGFHTQSNGPIALGVFPGVSAPALPRVGRRGRHTFCPDVFPPLSSYLEESLVSPPQDHLQVFMTSRSPSDPGSLVSSRAEGTSWTQASFRISNADTPVNQVCNQFSRC